MAGIGRRGDKSADIDLLKRKANRLKNDLALQLSSAMQDMMTGGVVGAALPAQNFILSARARRKGILVTMAFYIDKNTTSVKCELLAAKDNTGTDATVTHSKAIECKWEDVTDEERSAGYLVREFRTALEFNSIYKVTRTVAINDADGLTRKVKLPDTSPYTVSPVTDFVNRYSSARADQGTDACFQTGSSDAPTMFVDNCGGAETDYILPRPHPTAYVVAQKVNSRGVKPTLRIVVHKNTTRLRVVLIRQDEITTGADAYNAKIAEQIDIDSSQMSMVTGVTALPGENLADARFVKVRFHKPLDYNAVYNTILLVSRGDNVGGVGLDIIKNRTTGLSAIANGTFTAGQLSDGSNPDLAPANPFVKSTSTNGVLDGYVIRKRGVKAIMNFLIPTQTTNLLARIIERNASKKGLSDSWDDITDAERTAKKASRQFGPTLDFNTTYDLIRLAAEGTDIGGSGVDKARNPSSALTDPPTSLASFTTPDENGTFNGSGGNALSFVGITGRRYKKNGNGVLVKMKINAPKGTDRITVKILKISDNSASAQDLLIDYTFEDCFEEIDTAGFINRELPIKLDPTDTPATPNYGVVRLIAQGSGINSGGAGGANPDVYRNPKIKPAAPYTFLDNSSTVRTFSTINPIGFSGVTVPAVPLLAYLTNSIENDEPKVTMRVYYSTPGVNVGGSGVGGVLTANDIGNPTEAFLIINRAGQAGDTGTADKRKITTTISDPNSTFTDIEIEELKIGKQYYIPRVGLQAGTDVAKTSATNPLTDVKFRAGFEIDLSLLTAFSISQPLALDSRTSQVPISYTVPNGISLLGKNIIVEKDVIKNGTPTGYREFARFVLSNDQDNATPGVHNFQAQSTHPANAQIRYRATINPVKGGATSPLSPTLFPTNGSYDLTTDDPGFTDPDRPAYVTKTPMLRMRWKNAGTLKVKFNLPDTNMKTHDTNKLLFIFTARTVSAPVGTLITTTTYYFYNPELNTTPSDPGNFVSSITPIPSPSGSNAAYFFEVGKTGLATLDLDKPIFSDSAQNGDLPTSLASALRSAASSTAVVGGNTFTGSATLSVNVLIFNKAAVANPYRTIFSTTIPFSATSNFQGAAVDSGTD